MRTGTICRAFGLALIAFSAALGADYWPEGKNWATIAPSDAGMDASQVRSAVDYALKQQSLGVVVLRRGRIVAEAYSPEWGPDKQHEIFSAAKSVVSVLAGAALDEGKFKSLDQSASDFFPAWSGTDKSAITLRHLLTMTSGLRPRGLQVRNVQGDQLALNLAASLDHPPGAFWQYNTPAYHLMFHLVAKASGESFESYAARKLIEPLGMEHWSWVMNQGQGANGPVSNYYSAEASTRDMARFGLLLSRGGVWREKRLISASYVAQATAASQELNPSYGFLVWVNGRPGQGVDMSGPAAGGANSARLRFPGSPSDTFAALGAQSQDILVVPSLDLVVVRQGANPPDADFPSNLLRQVVAATQPAK